MVQVADDGQGFGGNVTPQPGHLGLHAARERTNAIGGTLVVRSAPGRGTVVVCRLPWPSTDDTLSNNGDASSTGASITGASREAGEHPSVVEERG